MVAPLAHQVFVLAGLGPAIHDFAGAGEGVDARPKAGHDGE